jgi:hypothetical protein
MRVLVSRCRSVGLAFALVSALSACGSGGPDSIGVAREGLLNAPLDADHTFDVGICAGGLKANGTCASWKCSGTLVAPNVVLTARHCIRQIAYADDFCASIFLDTPLTTATPLVTTSPSAISGTPKWYEVTQALLPAGNGLCSDDLALLILASEVPREEATPVKMDLHTDVATDPPASVAIVGRGAVTPSDKGGLQRRVLENVSFDCATDSAAQPCNVVDFSSPPTNMFASPPPYFVVGPSVLSGDSGSGVFAQESFDKKHPRVIGVATAETFAPDGISPSHGLVERLDTHRQFLQNIADQNP